jgi:hypothetical protein
LLLLEVTIFGNMIGADIEDGIVVFLGDFNNIGPNGPGNVVRVGSQVRFQMVVGELLCLSEVTLPLPACRSPAAVQFNSQIAGDPSGV